jgi:hypothetical protein
MAESVRDIAFPGAVVVPRVGDELGPCQPIHDRRPAETVAILLVGLFPSLDSNRLFGKRPSGTKCNVPVWGPQERELGVAESPEESLAAWRLDRC